MSDQQSTKYGAERDYTFSVYSVYCIKLIVSKSEPPPPKVNPDELDFLVHIKYDGDTIDDTVVDILSLANKVISKRAEREPDGETTAYKIRIKTDKISEGSNIYIRDEKKDLMSYMSISGILVRLIKEILDELDQIDEENGNETITEDGEYQSDLSE